MLVGTLNRLVREVSRDIRCRALPELVDRSVVLHKEETIVSDVEGCVQRLMPDVQFSCNESKGVLFPLLKYGFLDLTWEIGSVDWRTADVGGTSLLRELGFLISPKELLDQSDLLMGQDDDPTCLEELRDDITRRKSFLRVFLLEQPQRDLAESMIRLAEAGGMTEEFASGFLSGYFPKEYVIVDACLTNAPFIWFHKHFYW